MMYFQSICSSDMKYILFFHLTRVALLKMIGIGAPNLHVISSFSNFMTNSVVLMTVCFPILQIKVPYFYQGVFIAIFVSVKRARKFERKYIEEPWYRHIQIGSIQTKGLPQLAAN